MALNVAFLHGFLGSPAEWSFVRRDLEARRSGVRYFIPDLFCESPLSPRHSYQQWTSHFLSHCADQFQGERAWLVGYSMGARLALHAALKEPSRWAGVLLLAAHPGIHEPTAKAERWQWESNWERVFRESSWTDAIGQWNSQSVFTQTTPRAVPREGRFDRELVALSFSQWSTTKHLFSLDELKQAPVSLHWWFGALDSKFLGVKDLLQGQNVPGEYRVLPGVGHRIPLDCPGVVAEFLATVGER